MTITFLHASKSAEDNPGVLCYPYILLMPLGLTALSNLVRSKGFSSQIIHLAIESRLDPSFDPAEYLALNQRKIICLDLHWHYQSSAVIKAARDIKEKIPDAKIILGGFTASFFAPEIIREYKDIDFVIKGDAEVPLIRLIKLLSRGDDDFTSVPNLIWRKKNRLVINRQSYKVSQRIIDSLDFADFSTVKNGDHYNRMMINESGDLKFGKKNNGIFFYGCGRGCPVNCSFCAGSNISQVSINSRRKAILISHDPVISALDGFLKSGSSVWYLCFDPCADRRYYIDLFKKIRKMNMGLGIMFECWSLPGEEFIDQLVLTFDKNKSKIILSPECGSDTVRKKNKGYYFSNRDLLSAIKYISAKGFEVDVHFTAGLPFERKEDLIKTLQMINIIKNIEHAEAKCLPIEFEPASPWFMSRDKYGISSERKTFLDYYNIHKTKSEIGYASSYLSVGEICSFVRLMQAEAKCPKQESFFLKALTDGPLMINSCNFDNIHLSCRACENFNECFTVEVEGAFNRGASKYYPAFA
ncbi:MAG: cobalamin-dependent protein [Candidatus Omnitrophica bacterium]|nr:cobalamin-dependent protein [Candidatus Omnitrophota bacterium]